MKKTHKLLILVALVCTLLVCGMMSSKCMALDEDGGMLGETVYYSYDENSKTVYINGTGWMTYNKSPFENSDIEYVIIGDSVESIMVSAFSRCKNLKSVTIGKSVQYIGLNAFYGCENLETVYLGSGLPSTDHNVRELPFNAKIIVPSDSKGFWSDDIGVLYNKEKTILINYPRYKSEKYYKIFDGVQSINHEAFEYSNVEIVEIPDSVTSIGYEAFKKSKIKNIRIPEGVREISNGVFYDCKNLETVKMGNNVEKIYAEAFRGCEKFNGYIPESVSYIGTCAFYGTAITRVVIPNNVVTIPYGAFYDCKNLTFVYLGDSVIDIESCAFANCSNLSAVQFGNNVKTIGSHAFDEAALNTEIVFPDSVTSIGDYAFYGSVPQTIYFGSGLKTIGYHAFIPPYGSTVSNYARDIYYNGYEEDWEKLDIDTNNHLSSVGRNFHFNLHPWETCNHMCHKNDGKGTGWYKFCLFFWKLFKTNKECSCGIAHY